MLGVPIYEGAATAKFPWNAPGKVFIHDLCLYMVLTNVFTNP